MTQEEKARAYDKVLERARKQKHDYQKELDKIDKCSECAVILRAGIIAIELVLPELKENKDEEIRKALVDFFNSAVTKDLFRVFCHQNPDDVLAYLEKQKSND